MQVVRDEHQQLRAELEVPRELLQQLEDGLQPLDEHWRPLVRQAVHSLLAHTHTHIHPSVHPSIHPFIHSFIHSFINIMNYTLFHQQTTAHAIINQTYLQQQITSKTHN
jgi:hypothetical protein